MDRKMDRKVDQKILMLLNWAPEARKSSVSLRRRRHRSLSSDMTSNEKDSVTQCQFVRDS